MFCTCTNSTQGMEILCTQNMKFLTMKTVTRNLIITFELYYYILLFSVCLRLFTSLYCVVKILHNSVATALSFETPSSVKSYAKVEMRRDRSYTMGNIGAPLTNHILIYCFTYCPFCKRTSSNYLGTHTIFIADSLFLFYFITP